MQAKMQNRKSKRQYVEIIGDKNGKYLMVTAAYFQGWEMEEYVKRHHLSLLSRYH